MIGIVLVFTIQALIFGFGMGWVFRGLLEQQGENTDGSNNN